MKLTWGQFIRGLKPGKPQNGLSDMIRIFSFHHFRPNSFVSFFSRMSPVDQDIKRRIVDILSDHVYIPVYRTLDQSCPAYVGEPYSPTKTSFEFQPMAEAESSPKPPMSPFGRSPSLGSPLLVAKTSGKPVSSPSSKILLFQIVQQALSCAVQ